MITVLKKQMESNQNEENTKEAKVASLRHCLFPPHTISKLTAANLVFIVSPAHYK